MIRSIHVDKLTENIKEMCIEANHFLTEDMRGCLKEAAEMENSDLGKQILDQLQEKSEDCGGGYDPHLSGYRNGSIFSEGWPGSSF